MTLFVVFAAARVSLVSVRLSPAATSTTHFLWPGYGENSRVLAWIFRRCDSTVEARATPIGAIPEPPDLDLTGVNLAPGALEQLLEVDPDAVRAELLQVWEYLTQFGGRLPDEFQRQLSQAEARLNGK